MKLVTLWRLRHEGCDAYMSMGYCAAAHLTAYDEHSLLYTYWCCNLNIEGYKKYYGLEDGEIFIERSAFVEPEIRLKRRKMPSGKTKFFEKRIRQDVPLTRLMEQGEITVKNASGTWKTWTDGTDFMAMHIITEIFKEYQETGVIPEYQPWFS